MGLEITMERFGDMASQIPVVLVFLPVTASLIAFAKLVKTNVLSAFLLSYAISVRIMEKKNFRKYISGRFIKECPAY